MTAARAGCGAERLQGNIEVRGDSLRIRVYADPDPVTGKPVYLRETVRGTDDVARRTALRTLNRLVAEAKNARRPSSVVSLGHVIDEWLRVAEHEDSTRETYVGYIERTIKPALGSMSIAKLSVRHLETLYAELRRCRVWCGGKPSIEHKAKGEHDCVVAKCRPHGTVALTDGGLGQAGVMRRGSSSMSPLRSSFAGFRFPPEVIMVAVRWYLRYGLSYRDVEELLAERDIEVDHVTIFRWVQRFTPLLIDAARPRRRALGDRWFVDESYVKVAGRWVYLYRAIDQFGQVIDVLVSEKRDLAATRRFFVRALEHAPQPAEVTTHRAPAYPRVLDELAPAACHVMDQYSNNPIEADHGRLKSRLRRCVASNSSSQYE